jgi:uncharacterized protein (TIGR03084 family)
MDDATWRTLLDDLAAEASDLIDVLADLSDEQWVLPTPAEGWDIHDQVVHLAFFDEIAALGFTHPEAFDDLGAELLAAGDDYVDRASHDRRDMPPTEVLEWFRASRFAVSRAFADVGPSARTPWFGPSMSAASSATARLMETWAHGQDIYDALGLTHPMTDRVRHVCHLGVITRGFAFELNGLPAPTVEVRIELTSPGGETWAWGPLEADQRITGIANDFALVVTQRRHLFDTALQVTTGAAAEWMSIAQAFAGAASTGRPPHHVVEDLPRLVEDPPQ